MQEPGLVPDLLFHREPRQVKVEAAGGYLPQAVAGRAKSFIKICPG
jgi:hypothetical protein